MHNSQYPRKIFTQIKVFLFLVVLVLAITTFQGQTLAYDSACTWSGSSMLYDAHTLSSGWADAVSFGRNQWINVSPSPFDIFRNDYSTNDVTLGSTGGLAAVTTRGCIGSNINSADITFDSGKTWYTGSGSPGSSWDARHVATHEFGHALGFRHSSTNCNVSNSIRSTMCAGSSAGDTYKRSLESDDTSGMNTEYP